MEKDVEVEVKVQAEVEIEVKEGREKRGKEGEVFGFWGLGEG